MTILLNSCRWKLTARQYGVDRAEASGKLLRPMAIGGRPVMALIPAWLICRSLGARGTLHVGSLPSDCLEQLGYPSDPAPIGGQGFRGFQSLMCRKPAFGAQASDVKILL